MRVIAKPNISPIRAYVACYSSFTSTTTKNNFKAIASYINTQSNQYDLNAINSNLFLFPLHTNVHNGINKSDMKTLYENNMVENKRGRKIYDKLKSLAPLSRCPFCGIGTVTTLDHYLPKANFPTFAVLPYNLVASCKDCNTGKLATYATTKNSQTLHPYYDNFNSDQWLFARVLNNSKVEFYVNAPVSWRSIERDRVKSHFDNYNLKERFSVQATNVLADLREEFLMFGTSPVDIKQELQRKAAAYQVRHLNSWETALFQALSNSEWYCNGGYR